MPLPSLDGVQVFHLGERGSRTEDLRPAGVRLQSYNDITQECLMKRTMFEDPEFDYIPTFQGRKIQWLRPKTVSANAQFVIDGYSRFDIVQGGVGNCWLLAGMAALTLEPHLFGKVVPPDQSFTGPKYCGVFRFRIWHFGSWIEVVVDDLLPHNLKGELVFSTSSTSDEYWAALLEKAYAKFNGGYANLSRGDASEAMIPLTGGMCEMMNVSGFDDEALLHILRDGKSNGALITASILEENAAEEELLVNGLVHLHVYTVTDCPRIQQPAVQLIKLRNPWGSTEWSGAWSDGAAEWATISDGEKAAVGYTNHEDGEFFMSQHDFMQNFTTLELCHTQEVTSSEWYIREYLGAWDIGKNAGGKPSITAIDGTRYRAARIAQQ